MTLPKIADFKRAFEILVHPPVVSQVFTDFKILKQDVRIAEVAKSILPYIFALSALGLGYSFYVGATLPACLCGVVLVISLAAYIRFSQFERQIHRDLDVKNFALAALDWEDGVPDPDSNPIALVDKANLQTNLKNIEKIVKMTPPPIKKVIEKCWAYALKQKNPYDYCQACIDCHTAFPKSQEGRPITFVCTDGQLRLPNFARALLKNHDKVGKIKEESLSRIVMDGISMKGLFRWTILSYIPHNTDLGTTKIQGFPYFNSDLKEDTDFNETIEFLKTLSVNHGNEENYVRQNIESTLSLSKQHLNNKSLMDKLKEAKVASLTLGSDVTDEDLVSLEGFALERILSQSSHITEKGLKHLDGMPIAELTLQAVTNEVLKAIGDWKTLKKLKLINPAREEGLKYLDGVPIQDLTLHIATNETLKVIAGWKTITYLTLVNPASDKDGIAHLEQLPSLQVLKYTGAKFPLEALSSIEKMVPKLLRLDVDTPEDKTPYDVFEKKIFINFK